MSSFQVTTQFSHWMLDPQEIESTHFSLLQEHYGVPAWELPTLFADENDALRFFTKQIFIIFGMLGNESPKIRNNKWRVALCLSLSSGSDFLGMVCFMYYPRLATIFLAGKTENHFVSLHELVKIYSKASNESVLEAEMLLLDQLKFDLKVHHPQNCVHSLLADMKRMTSQDHPEIDKNKLSEAINTWLSQCEKMLYLLQTSSAPLSHSPLSLAVFALQSTATEEVTSMLELGEYFPRALGSSQWAVLLKQRPQLERYLQEVQKDFNPDRLSSFMLLLKKQNKWSNQSKQQESIQKNPDEDTFS
eukprot:scaffold3993_cov161-Ochromonas_danica.AAC.4